MFNIESYYMDSPAGPVLLKPPSGPIPRGLPRELSKPDARLIPRCLRWGGLFSVTFGKKYALWQMMAHFGPLLPGRQRADAVFGLEPWEAPFQGPEFLHTRRGGTLPHPGRKEAVTCNLIHPPKRWCFCPGGLDSTTCLALAREQGFSCHALSFDYGQRHAVELKAAALVAENLGAAQHKVIRLDLRAIGGSALTDEIEVPKNRSLEEMDRGIPVTYVPARNTLFLSYALAYAETLMATRHFYRRERAGLFRLPGLPPGVHSRLRKAGRTGHQTGRRRR